MSAIKFVENFIDNLAVECEQKELWQYAGLCWLAAARCQGTLGNVLTEINFLTKAGRSFIVAKNKNNHSGCSYSGQENLQVIKKCNFKFISVLMLNLFN